MGLDLGFVKGFIFIQSKSLSKLKLVGIFFTEFFEGSLLGGLNEELCEVSDTVLPLLGGGESDRSANRSEILAWSDSDNFLLLGVLVMGVHLLLFSIQRLFGCCIPLFSVGMGTNLCLPLCSWGSECWVMLFILPLVLWGKWLL